MDDAAEIVSLPRSAIVFRMSPSMVQSRAFAQVLAVYVAAMIHFSIKKMSSTGTRLEGNLAMSLFA
jgi:hypothetical protein